MARYTVPADVVEQHILTLIRQDLAKLRDDGQLHRHVEDELRRLRGGQEDAREQLQRRLADLDQQLAKLRDHLLALDPDTAKSLGFYEQAQRTTHERATVEAELQRLQSDEPTLPPAAELKRRIAAEFDHLEDVLASGTIEEKRDLIACYVQSIKADPDQQTVHIGLYPALLSQRIAGASFRELEIPFGAVRFVRSRWVRNVRKWRFHGGLRLSSPPPPDMAIEGVRGCVGARRMG